MIDWAHQDGKCGICERLLENTRNTHIDHDHADGHVRGILCHSCNNGLGNFKDNPTSLFAAIAYLADTSLHGILELSA